LNDEDRLIEAARSDRRAFGVLYDRHFDSIYHYIAKRVGDREVTEDLTSAVWERALNAITRYEIRGVPFSAWLYRIAGNLVANYHRSRHVHPHVGIEAVTAGEEPDDEGRLAMRQALVRAMSALSEADQEVLSLSYHAGLAPTEIAAVLNCSAVAVHKRLQRARLRLRERLEAEGVSVD
jgi:RNA polymerase sigma-70 factor (ECF subfamily)